MNYSNLSHPRRALQPRTPCEPRRRPDRRLLLLAPLVVGGAFAAPLAVSAALDRSPPSPSRATTAPAVAAEQPGAIPVQAPNAGKISTLGAVATLPGLQRPKPSKTPVRAVAAPAPAAPVPAATAAPPPAVAPTVRAAPTPAAPAPEPTTESFDDSGPSPDQTFDSSG